MTTTSVAGVGYGVKTQFFDKKPVEQSTSSPPQKTVEGAKVEKNENEKKETSSNSLVSLPSSKDIQKDVEKKLEAIKEEVTNLKPLDVATSSPQVQKILNDIKTLEQYPRNQAREICENICKSF